MADVDWQAELDAFENLHGLFNDYNQLYFNNTLGKVTVEWSSNRMVRSPLRASR